VALKTSFLRMLVLSIALGFYDLIIKPLYYEWVTISTGSIPTFGHVLLGYFLLLYVVRMSISMFTPLGGTGFRGLESAIYAVSLTCYDLFIRKQYYTYLEVTGVTPTVLHSIIGYFITIYIGYFAVWYFIHRAEADVI